MSAWRLDELYTEDEGGLIADLEVMPGDPATHRRIERLERAVAEHPGVWQNRVALAQALVQDGRFEPAARQLRAGLELVGDPQVLSALFFNLGVCEEGQEHWVEAAAAYEQCAFLMPRLYWAHHGLGSCLYRQGQYAAAIVALRRALALEPDTEEGHRTLAEIYIAAGLLHEAEAECRWLLDTDPDSLWPATTLASLRARLN